MAHPLGIPRITLADHAQYNDMKAWVLDQNWMPPEFIKRAALYEGITGRKYPVKPLSEEDLDIDHAKRQEARLTLEKWDEIRKRDAREKEHMTTTRPAFNHGLYGKDYGHRRKDD